MPRLVQKLLWWTALLVGVAATPLKMQASSVTIFNSFGPGHSSDCCGGWAVQSLFGPTFTNAQAFTPSATSPLFAIDVAIGFMINPAQFTLALVTDNGGQPGSLIESWNLTTTFPVITCTHCFETAFSTQNPILQAGTEYWVVALPGPGIDALWMSNNIGAVGTSAFSLDDGKTWTVTTTGSFAAFDVRGITSVPEPSMLVMVGTGLLGLAGATRRKLRTGFRNTICSCKCC